ncbi:MAG: hypothetical protein Q9201_007583 [Fulgogasparrea decipioides]
MLSSIANISLVAAVLYTAARADPIAFGNPSFTGITFGSPFSISWYGGDGTPVTINLLDGNPAALKNEAVVATNVTGTNSFDWTPVISSNVQPGQPLVFQIVQSGLTNYSPTFSIAAPAQAATQLRARYGAPLPVGTAYHYPVRNHVAPKVANVYNSASGASTTGALFPLEYTTIDDDCFSNFLLENCVFLRAGSAAKAPIGTAWTTVGTGNAAISRLAYVTGDSYNYLSPTGTGTGSAVQAAVTASTSPIEPYINNARRLSSNWWTVLALSSAGCVLLLSWM